MFYHHGEEYEGDFDENTLSGYGTYYYQEGA